MQGYSEAERSHLHQHLDELLDLDGVDAFDLSLAVYHDTGVKVFAFRKGSVIPEDLIRTDLHLLADKCQKMGTASALAMLSLIRGCIMYLEQLYDESPAENTSEVVQ